MLYSRSLLVICFMYDSVDMLILTVGSLMRVYCTCPQNPGCHVSCQLTLCSSAGKKKKNPPTSCRRPRFNSWIRKIPWKGDGLPTPVFLGFPRGSDGKESICNARDLGSIPGLGRSPGRGHGNPVQSSCLENPMDRGAWWATVHGVTNSHTQRTD